MATIEREEEEYRVTIRGPKARNPESDPNRPLTLAKRKAHRVQIGLFWVGLALAILQAWQLCEFRNSMQLTRTSNEIARHAMEVGSRAWLLVDRVEGDPTQGDVLVYLKNTGKTPATYVYADGNVLMHEKGDIGGISPYNFPEDPRKVRSLATVGPDQILKETMTIDPLPGDTVAARINSGDTLVFVSGYTLYWDEFGVQRGLSYCMYWKPAKKTYGFCSGFNEPW